jgi:hypothetical protein
MAKTIPFTKTPPKPKPSSGLTIRISIERSDDPPKPA